MGIITVPLHIGDFLSGTMHMDTLEKGAYIMLILAHYQIGEEGLPNDDKKLSRIAGVTPKVWNRIKDVLAEKFTITENFWVSKKCVEVLREVEQKISAQRAKALKKHRPGDAAAQPQQCQPKPKPYKKKISKDISQKKLEKPPDVSDQVWIDFNRQRKTKLTETGLGRIIAEAEKAGMTLDEALSVSCARGWQGFEADWVKNERFSNSSARNYADKSDLADQIAREVQAEYGACEPDYADGEAVFRHSGYLREDARAIEKPDAGHD